MRSHTLPLLEVAAICILGCAPNVDNMRSYVVSYDAGAGGDELDEGDGIGPWSNEGGDAAGQGGEARRAATGGAGGRGGRGGGSVGGDSARAAKGGQGAALMGTAQGGAYRNTAGNSGGPLPTTGGLSGNASAGGAAGKSAGGAAGASVGGAAGRGSGGALGAGGLRATGGVPNAAGGAPGVGGLSSAGRGGVLAGTGGIVYAAGGASVIGVGGGAGRGGALAGAGGASAVGGASGAGGAIATGGASGRGGASGSGGASGAGGASSTTYEPLCANGETKNGSCSQAGAVARCYAKCGPNSLGFKGETCTSGVYVEGNCSFPPGDYACYKLPSSAPAQCPTSAPQATHACTVPSCTVCGGTATQITTGYLDSSGTLKSGYCVCWNGAWTCGTASTQSWPCPGSNGC